MLSGELYRTIREFIPMSKRRRVAEEWMSILDEFEHSVSDTIAQDAEDDDSEEVDEDNAQPEAN